MAVEYPEGTWLSPHPAGRNGDSSTDPSGGADESPTPTGESGTAYDLADNLTARLWLRRGDRRFVGVLAGLGLLMLTLRRRPNPTLRLLFLSQQTNCSSTTPTLTSPILTQ